MRDQIDQCRYLNLRELSEPEDNCLRLVVEEMHVGAEAEELVVGEASFGDHDVRAVQAPVGGPAADASRAMGAAAYATGERVAFAAAPDLRTAAHEAAHVVQQRAGVALPAGIGQSGDAYPPPLPATAAARSHRTRATPRSCDRSASAPRTASPVPASPPSLP
jgi:hypothetical protein